MPVPLSRQLFCFDAGQRRFYRVHQRMTDKLDISPVGFIQVVLKRKNGRDFVHDFHYTGSTAGPPGPGRRSDKGNHFDPPFFRQLCQPHIKAWIINGQQHVRFTAVHKFDKSAAELPDIRKPFQYFHKTHDAMVFDIEQHLPARFPQTVAAHTKDFRFRFQLFNGAGHGAGMQVAGCFPRRNQYPGHDTSMCCRPLQVFYNAKLALSGRFPAAANNYPFLYILNHLIITQKSS